MKIKNLSFWIGGWGRKFFCRTESGLGGSIYSLSMDEVRELGNSGGYIQTCRDGYQASV